MSTEFPGAVDSPTDPTPTSPMNNPDHATQHANSNDAIVAIEEAIGTTSAPKLVPMTIGSAGHPTTGTWTVGTSIIDSNGITWNCTVAGAPGTWAASAGSGDLLASNNLSDVANAVTALGNLGGAPLASPALTGSPTAPTKTPLTDNTDLATTAYADAAVAVETSRAETAEGLKLAKAANLSDVASPAVALSNLGGTPETSGTAGHPTTGTWAAGQSVVDSNGVIWNCTVSGTPGTWVEVLVGSSDQGASRFNLAIPSLSAVAAVAVANVNIASPGATLDGYSILTNDEILLTGQTTASQNGVWTWNGASSALTRPNEFPTNGVVKRGRSVDVINGTVHANTTWILDSTAAGITIDTTSQTWTALLSTTGDVVIVGKAATLQDSANVQAIITQTGVPANVASPITGMWHMSAVITDWTGATDQTSIMQTLVDAVVAAGGGTILHDRKGTPLIAGSVVWANNVSLMGVDESICGFACTSTTGACFRALTTDGFSLASPLTGCDFDKFTVNGSGASGSFNVQAKGFSFQYYESCHWNRVRCLNIAATGFGMDYPLGDVVINECVANNCGRLGTAGTSLGCSGIGIGVQDASSGVELYQITNCTALNNANYGIYREAQNVLTLADWTSYAIISGNFCSGNRQGIGECGGNYSIITDNECYGNTHAGIAANDGTFNGTPSAPSYRSFISGNHCFGNTGDGIIINENATTSNLFEGSVTNNVCFGNTQNGIRLILGSGTDLTAFIDSNRCAYNGLSGIRVETGSGTEALINSSISNNECWGNGTAATAGNLDGINIQSLCTNVNIKGNVCYDIGSTQGHGLVLGAVFTGGSIVDNDFRNNVTAGASVSTNVSATTWFAHNAGTAASIPVAVSPGGSPWTYTAPAFPTTLALTSATAITGITVAGVAYPPAIGAIPLEASDSVVITYTGTLAGTTRAR